MMNDWISKKERLPEKNGEYLCTLVQNAYHSVRICDFEDGQFIVEREFSDVHVIAWMELPLIYDENSDDNNSDWIPKQERSPEKDGEYLGTIKLYNYYEGDYYHDVIGDGPQCRVMICKFMNNSFSEERCYPNIDVIAWMNIPSVYKETENDD